MTAPALFDHQKAAIEFIGPRAIFALFMEMGTGKSKVIVERAAGLWAKGEINAVIVIGPGAVKEQWIDEQFTIHWPRAGGEWCGCIWDGFKTKKAGEAFNQAVSDLGRLFVFSVNVEAFQWDSVDDFFSRILRTRKTFLVIDESTRIKNGRRRPTRGKRAGAKRTNKLLDFAPLATHRAILTGTPTPKSPFDLWSQFEFLKPNFFGMDYFVFTHYYGIMMQKTTNEGKRYDVVLDEDTYNRVKFQIQRLEMAGTWDRYAIEGMSARLGTSIPNVFEIKKMTRFTPYKNMDELKEKISTITFYKRKAECFDLPDKIYETLNCTMGEKQATIYKELKKSMMSTYAGKELTVMNKAVLAMRLQMVSGGLFPHAESVMKVSATGEEFEDSAYTYTVIDQNGKLEALIEDLEEVSPDTSIIVWARFRGEIDQITDRLNQEGYPAKRYYGGIGNEVISEFKRGDFRVLVANPLKGGEGLNLQIATLHYFYSNPHKADTRLQAEDRSHRYGQVNKVTYKDLVCRGTVDEKILKVLKARENLINYFRTAKLEDFA